MYESLNSYFYSLSSLVKTCFSKQILLTVNAFGSTDFSGTRKL